MTNSYRVKKANYRVTNWAEYDQALVNRGDVTVWLEKGYLENNWIAKSTGKRGAPKIYSDEAIQVMLTKPPFRALEGFGQSLMRLMRHGKDGVLIQNVLIALLVIILT
jgi:hypothetical protein